MNKSKEKIKENPIVANRAIYMANPCHIIDKVVPLYWHNSYTNEKKPPKNSPVGAFFFCVCFWRGFRAPSR